MTLKKYTRGSKSIDRIFVNFSRSVTNSGTLAPLESAEEVESDHRIAFCKFKLQRKESFRWESYLYRQHMTEEEERFKQWIVMHDWKEV